MSVELDRLSEAHRLAQSRLAASSSQSLLSVWRLLDGFALDATSRAWLDSAVPIVIGQRRVSASLAAAYLDAIKKAALGADAVLGAVLDAGISEEQVVTSLTVTGPVSVKSATARGVSVVEAMESGAVGVARAGSRMVLGGGRETVLRTVAADGVGWARITSGKPCAFCAMLASRGAVYGRESGAFQAHDGCHCGVQPLYGGDLPASSERWAGLWGEASGAEGDTVKVFSALVAGLS